MTKRKFEEELRRCVRRFVFWLIFITIFAIALQRYLPKMPELTPEEKEELLKKIDENPSLYYDILDPLGH